jgi:phage terminase large subunit GpA-like protein
VTTNAYTFYRSLRAKGLASRFHLVKGDGRVNAPRTWIDFPDQKRKDRFAAAKGDVPVLFLNSNMLKDVLSNRLDVISPGKGMVRFPDWLEPWFYKELCAERRTEKGWKNTQGTRNEAWDLLYYCIGACVSPLLRIEHFDWTNPPSWAGEWNVNPLVVETGKLEQALTQGSKVQYDFAALGKALA